MQESVLTLGRWQQIVMPGELSRVQRVQEDVQRALVSCQFTEREVFRVLLALEEALVNAIKHGNRLDGTKKVYVRYRVNSARFDVCIMDEGQGFNLDAVPNPTADENLERLSGRGLLLMRHFMTEVVFHPPGNRLSMCMVRNQRNSPESGALTPCCT